jgi:hypothetical protein
MRRSRLNKSLENKNRKTIILSILGIAIILFLFFRFGIDALVNFSLFVSGSKSQSTSQSSNQINYVATPILNPLPSATNSAQIVISGTSLKNYNITLYLNNTTDQTQADNNGNFNFVEQLLSGDNQIKVQAEYNNNKSDFSNSVTVSYSNSQPTLDINSPTDGQKFDKNSIGNGNTVIISGKTDPGDSVTVNGFWAVIDDNNNFSYTLPVQSGDTQIKVIATDQAGNRTEKDLKINFSP